MNTSSIGINKKVIMVALAIAGLIVSFSAVTPIIADADSNALACSTQSGRTHFAVGEEITFVATNGETKALIWYAPDSADISTSGTNTFTTHFEHASSVPYLVRVTQGAGNTHQEASCHVTISDTVDATPTPTDDGTDGDHPCDAPAHAQFNPFPVTFDGVGCNDYPLIDGAGPDGKYSTSHADLANGVTVNPGDTVRMRVYVHNGGEPIEANKALNAGVQITIPSAGTERTTHTISATAIAGNIPAISGSFNIHTPAGTRLEVVPNSGEIRDRVPKTIDTFTVKHGANLVPFGDMEACFDHLRWVVFEVRVVADEEEEETPTPEPDDPTPTPSPVEVCELTEALHGEIYNLNKGNHFLVSDAYLDVLHSQGARQWLQALYNLNIPAGDYIATIQTHSNGPITQTQLYEMAQVNFRFGNSNTDYIKALASDDIPDGQQTHITEKPVTFDRAVGNMYASHAVPADTSSPNSVAAVCLGLRAVGTPTPEPGDPALTIIKEVRNTIIHDDWRDHTTAIQGDVVQFKFDVQNTGDANVNNVFVRDLLPAGLVYHGGLTVNGADYDTYKDGFFASGINMGTLRPAPADRFEVIFNARVTADGPITLTNRATALAGGVDPATDTASVEVQNFDDPGTPALTITKEVRNVTIDGFTSNETTADQGDTVEFTIVVRNTGDADALNVTVNDALTTGLSYQAPTLNINGLGAHGQSTALFGTGANLGTLTPGEQHFIVFRATVDAATGVIPNDAYATATDLGWVHDEARVRLNDTPPDPDTLVCVPADQTVTIKADEVINTLFRAQGGEGAYTWTRNGAVMGGTGAEQFLGFDANHAGTTIIRVTSADGQSANCAFTLIVEPVDPEKTTLRILKSGRVYPDGAWNYTLFDADEGDIVDFRMEVTNTGNHIAENVVVRDTLPGGFDYNGTAWINGVQTSDVTASGFFVVVNIGDLAVGETKTVTFLTTVRDDFFPTDITVTNDAETWADNVDPDGDDFDDVDVRITVATDPTTLTCSQNLSNPVLVNTSVTFTAGGGTPGYTWFIDGTQVATGTSFTHTFTDDGTFAVQVTDTSSPIQIATCTVVVEPVDPGGTPTLRIVKSGHRYPAGAWSDTQFNAQENDTVEFQLLVTNTGDARADNVRITDTLPSGISYVGPTWRDGVLTTDITDGITLTHLDQGRSTTVTFLAEVDDTFSSTTIVTNTGIVRADNVDFDPADHRDTVDVRVGVTAPRAPVLDIEKTVRNITDGTGGSNGVNAIDADPNDEIEFVLRVTNNGNGAARNVRISDVLDNRLTYLSTSVDSGRPFTGLIDSTSGMVFASPLGAGVTETIRVRARVADADAFGNGTSTIPNRADVSADNANSDTDDASVEVTRHDNHVSCSPTGITIDRFQDITFFASGGNGSYTWHAPTGTDDDGFGGAFTTSFAGVERWHAVRVHSAGLHATCSVYVRDVTNDTHVTIDKQVRNVTQNIGQSNNVFARPGDIVEFVLRVTNNRSNAVSSVRVWDNLPVELINPSLATIDGFGQTGSVVHGNSMYITLGAHQTKTIRFTAQVRNNSYFSTTNTIVENRAYAEVGGNTDFDNAFVNVDRSLTGVDGTLSIIKRGRNLAETSYLEKTHITAHIGNTVQFILYVRNTGSSTVSHVVVRDPMPFGFTYVNGSTAVKYTTDQFFTQVDDGITTSGINIGSLAPTQEVVIRFDAEVYDTGFAGNTYHTHNVAFVHSPDLDHELSATLPITISRCSILCTVGQIPTGAGGVGNMLALVTLVSALMTSMYAGYTRTDVFKNRDARTVVAYHRTQIDRFNFAR